MNDSPNPAAERLYFVFSHVGVGDEDILGMLDQALLTERRVAESGSIDTLRELVSQIEAAKLPDTPALVAARQLIDRQRQDAASTSEASNGETKS